MATTTPPLLITSPPHGVTRADPEEQTPRASAPAGSAPAVGDIPATGENEEGPRGQPAPDRPARPRGNRHRPPPPGLLDDPASTGAQILTDLASLPISEMRQHLRRELAHRPTPGPAHRIPIRLSNDEYTHAHTAGQNLETK